MPLPRANPPTAEQQRWLTANKSFKRMSHDIVGKYSNRGTLTADGHFIREAKGKPVLDGNGSFGVGVPAPVRKRR